MSRRDSDSLEDFFRKATRHHDLEYNEADWQKLERMLDEQQPVRPAGWFGAHGRKALMALVAVTAVVAVLLLLPGRQISDTVPASPAGETDSGIAAVPDVQHDDAITTPRAEDNAQVRETIRPDVTQDSRQVREQNSVDPSNTSAPAPRRADIASGAVAERSNVQTVEPNREIYDESNEDNNIEKDPARINEKDLSDVSGFNHTQAQPPAPADRIGNAPGAEELVSEVQDQPADSASAEPTADALEAPKTRRHGFDETRGRFGISVIAAPDFSMTAKGGAMGAGDAMGVFLHYQVLPRWGVSAGVLLDNKQYWGKGHEYQPPYGYWKALTNGVVPDRIDGTCSMYEVPVSVTFDILSTRRTRLFASAGLSSYFVQSEEYYYHFDTPNPGAVNGWTGKRPSTLWFGIGTLSAGFDFRATRTLSLGIEPYFKVPLEGMGWADIDLYSTGVMFAARYHFARKGNKHPPTIQGP